VRTVENPTTGETTNIPDGRTDRSIPELFRRLRDETSTLFRQELELAKAEMSEKAAKFSRNAIYLAIGGLIAYAGLIFLLLGLGRLVYLGLLRIGASDAVALWVAPMVIAVVVGAIGYGFVQKAISTFRHERVAPQKTVQSLQENKAWLKQKMQ
jgi:hypothetical protein